jgi:hypothetical protein
MNRATSPKIMKRFLQFRTTTAPRPGTRTRCHFSVCVPRCYHASTPSPQHSPHPAQDEAPHAAVKPSQTSQHRSRNVLKKLSFQRMASCACRATVSAFPLVAPSLVSSAPRPAQLLNELPPLIALTSMFLGKVQSRAGHCFIILLALFSPFKLPIPLVLSLKPSSGRRYACITLADITRNGFLSCNTGASPRYDLHNPLSVRIFFSTSYFE